MRLIKQNGGNAEEFIVSVTDNIGIYKNSRFDFRGTLDQAKEHAKKCKFGGGVKILRKYKNGFCFYEEVK